MSNATNFQLLIPKTMPNSVGYSQLAVVTGGAVVFIAGQVALDKSGNIVGKDDFKAQVQQVFENLSAAVEAAGGRFSDIIKLNYYLVDLSHLPELREVRDKYIDLKNPPASTAVQVPKLFRLEFLIEVEAIAVVPSSLGSLPRKRAYGRMTRNSETDGLKKTRTGDQGLVSQKSPSVMLLVLNAYSARLLLACSCASSDSASSSSGMRESRRVTRGRRELRFCSLTFVCLTS